MEHRFAYDAQTAVVQTAQGKVRGFEWDGLTIFKGIPYAAAKRFHAPEPVPAWEDVLDCTSFGYVCPLLEDSKPTGELLVPHRYWLMDENCQNLNVWTPACDGKKRPVLVWLHGGGYVAGSAIEHDAYEGEAMARLADVVSVSINHRLNILGYMDLSDYGEEYANSANAGGDDIIASLRWVKENIAAFGGDPENVTVYGQSGGGGKVTTLLQSPAADGLFQKGMVMSGVLGRTLADATGSGKPLVEAMLKELGLKKAQQLETVPYHDLGKAYLKVRPALRKAGKYVGCSPKPNAFYAGDPLQVGFRKESAGVPLLVGSVFGEFTSFAENTMDRKGMAREAQVRYLTELFGKEQTEELIGLFTAAYPERPLIDIPKLDTIFREPEIAYIRERSKLNSATWSYLFNQDLPLNGGQTPWHCIDIPYWFHNTDMVPTTQVPGVVEKLEEQMFGALMAFAKTGDPNHAGIPAWPASTPEREAVILFDADTRVVCNHDHALIPAVRKAMEPIQKRMMEESMKKAQH